MGFIIGYVWVGTSVDDCNNRVDQNTAYVDDGWYANLSCLALIVEGGRRGRKADDTAIAAGGASSAVPGGSGVTYAFAET